MAQGILNTWFGCHYRVVPILPGGGDQQSLKAPPPVAGAAAEGHWIEVAPTYHCQYSGQRCGTLRRAEPISGEDPLQVQAAGGRTKRQAVAY